MKVMSLFHLNEKGIQKQSYILFDLNIPMRAKIGVKLKSQYSVLLILSQPSTELSDRTESGHESLLSSLFTNKIVVRLKKSSNTCKSHIQIAIFLKKLTLSNAHAGVLRIVTTPNAM